MCSLKTNAASPIGQWVKSNHFAVVVDGKPTLVGPKGTKSLPALSTYKTDHEGPATFFSENALEIIVWLPCIFSQEHQNPQRTLQHLIGNLVQPTSLYPHVCVLILMPIRQLPIFTP